MSSDVTSKERLKEGFTPLNLSTDFSNIPEDKLLTTALVLHVGGIFLVVLGIIHLLLLSSRLLDVIPTILFYSVPATIFFSSGLKVYRKYTEKAAKSNKTTENRKESVYNYIIKSERLIIKSLSKIAKSVLHFLTGTTALGIVFYVVYLPNLFRYGNVFVNLLGYVLISFLLPLVFSLHLFLSAYYVNLTVTCAWELVWLASVRAVYRKNDQWKKKKISIATGLLLLAALVPFVIIQLAGPLIYTLTSDNRIMALPLIWVVFLWYVSWGYTWSLGTLKAIIKRELTYYQAIWLAWLVIMVFLLHALNVPAYYMIRE